MKKVKLAVTVISQSQKSFVRQIFQPTFRLLLNESENHPDPHQAINQTM